MNIAASRSCFCVLLSVLLYSSTSTTADESRVPRWDSRGFGLVPSQGIACLDVSDDGARIVVGTIAAPGYPNVHVLDAQGKVRVSYRVGQRWIEQVAATDGDKARALCTMTTGASGDEPQAYLCGADVSPVANTFGGTSLFHYGDHSNHIGKRLVGYPGGAVTVNQDQVLWMNDATATPHTRASYRNLKVTALGVHPSGMAIVGGYVDGDVRTKEPSNLFVYKPSTATPVWSRKVLSDVGASTPPEPGEYGTPIHPNGKRQPLAQRDEPMFAPLSIAVTGSAEFNDAPRIATADYRGWQRWIRSSGSGKEEHYGTRFMPAKPAVTVYDSTGNEVRRLGGPPAAYVWLQSKRTP